MRVQRFQPIDVQRHGDDERETRWRELERVDRYITIFIDNRQERTCVVTAKTPPLDLRCVHVAKTPL